MAFNRRLKHLRTLRTNFCRLQDNASGCPLAPAQYFSVEFVSPFSNVWTWIHSFFLLSEIIFSVFRPNKTDAYSPLLHSYGKQRRGKWKKKKKKKAVLWLTLNILTVCSTPLSRSYELEFKLFLFFLFWLYEMFVSVFRPHKTDTYSPSSTLRVDSSGKKLNMQNAK